MLFEKILILLLGVMICTIFAPHDAFAKSFTVKLFESMTLDSGDEKKDDKDAKKKDKKKEPKKKETKKDSKKEKKKELTKSKGKKTWKKLVHPSK